MRSRTYIIIIIAVLVPHSVFGQSSLVSKWEKVGPVNFTAAVQQSPSTIVATTSHGYIYITHDNGTSWQRREVGDTLDLTAISFGDSLHGMILVNGDALATTDGGVTWQPNKAPKNIAPFYVACIGSDTTFIVNWIGNIYRTIDGGANWVEQFTVSDTATSTSNIPTKMVFFDNQRGYVLGVGMYVQTTDAGVHWYARQIEGQDGAFTTLYDIDFYNSDIGVMSGSDDYFTTTDGGTNWTDHPMPHDERNDYLPIVRMFGPQSFFMFGTPNAYYYYSNDFGATFTLSQMRQANSVTSVVKTSPGSWLAVGGGWLPAAFQYGAGGTILRGTFNESDIAPEWSVIAECPMGTSPQVHATNGGLLQSVSGSVSGGWNAFPLISTDSGIFWHVTNDVIQDYSGINFPSPDTGYLYNSDDLTAGMQTLDSGQSWHSIEMHGPPISANRGIGQVSFGSCDTGYAYNGYVLSTADEGIDWNLDSLPSAKTESPYQGYEFYERNTRGIVSPDGSHAFLLAYVVDTLIVRDTNKYKSFWDSSKTQNLIYRTTDCGATWSNIGSVPTNDLRISIYFRNDLVGYLLSDSGRIYRTPDGGNSWNIEQLAPFGYTFNNMIFLNDRIGFLSLDSQAVMETTDGGLSWTWLLIPTNREEVSMTTGNISFPDSSTVLVYGVRTLYVTPSIQDYGLYRAKINIPPSSIVEQKPPSDPNSISISAYPNPARDEMRVRLTAAENGIASIEVLDVLGRSVIESRAGTNSDFSLDLNSLPNGIYSLRSTLGSQSATSAFTIVR